MSNLNVGQGGQKKVQKRPNSTKWYGYHTEKNLKSKNVGGKSLYFSQGC